MQMIEVSNYYTIIIRIYILHVHRWPSTNRLHKEKKKICHAMRLQVIRQHVLVVTSNMYTPETVSYTEYMSAAYDY